MKRLELLLPMNLQFFADGEEGGGEGENVAEVAEQPTETVSEATESAGEESEGATEETTDPQPQSAETNRAFAELRRRAEAAEKKAAELDNYYATQFGQYTNPETGQPIKSAEDYIRAMAAQERVKAREQLRENNIDPALVDNLIANSPIVKQAEAATKELNQFRLKQQINEDLSKILALDDSYSSVDELMRDPIMSDVVAFVEEHPGIRADEAYKIVNFDKLRSSAQAAAKQAAVNSVKGKNHLTTGAALNVDDGGVDIPADQIEMYKDAFPDKTLKEIKALYNKAIGLRR